MAQAIEAIDVNVPVSVAYDQWTQFEEFPKFLDEVESIQQLTDVLTQWRVKVGPVEESFEAVITEQHKDERVAWNSTGGTVDHAGVVTFHKLSDTTSRVTVQIDWAPKGVLEKLGGTLGVDNRAIKKDLKNFKEYIEAKGTPDGAGPATSTRDELIRPGPVVDRFESGGHTLLSRTAGDAGRVEVVLVHGVGLGSGTLRPLAHVLESNAHVTWVELPGFGRTPPQDPFRLMADQSDFLAAFLRSRGIIAAVLVGHSMGTAVVAGVAARHPDLVSRVVLIGPVTDPRARSRVQQGVRLIRDTWLEPPATNLIVLREYVQCGPRRYLIALSDMLRFDLERTAPLIEQPVLILRGRHDPISRRAWCESVVACFPSARLVHIPGGAHLVLHSHPNRVAAAIRAFAAEGDV